MMAISLNSCSNDDDNSSSSGVNNSAIQGKWYFSEWGYVYEGIEFYEDYDNECETQKDYVEFGSNTYNSRIHDYDCSYETEVGTYTIDGNLLKITYTEEGETVTHTSEILELNENTFKFKVTETYDGIEATVIQILKRS